MAAAASARRALRQQYSAPHQHQSPQQVLLLVLRGLIIISRIMALG